MMVVTAGHQGVPEQMAVRRLGGGHAPADVGEDATQAEKNMGGQRVSICVRVCARRRKHACVRAAGTDYGCVGKKKRM